MSLIKVFSIYAFVTLLSDTVVNGQAIDTDMFQQKIDQYNSVHPRQVLFVQTDKTVYTNNETVWFAGYLMHDVKDGLLKPDILTVALFEESTRKITVQKKYLLSNGLCSGSLLLSDDIQPGNYQLMAFTNLVRKNGEPLAVFRQHLRIESIKDLPFSTNFTITDSLLTTDTLRIDVKVILPGVGTGLASYASVDYHLNAEQSATLKLDMYGRGSILVPRAKIEHAGQFLFTTTKYKNELQYFNVQLPHPQREDSIHVLFYPEGGDLVNGLYSRVGWEVKTNFGAPVQATVLLMKNGRITDTLKNANYGIGVLSLLPERDTQYVVRLLVDNKKNPWKDFPLPAALQRGVVLEIINAIAADTLNIHVKSSTNRTVYLAISNTEEVTVSDPIEINKERNIHLPLDKISKGVNTITVLDEQHRPLTERLFFAHFNRKVNAALQTDKLVYKTRTKVSLDVQLTDADKAGVGGLFTIACVQDNRIESGNHKDIESYYYIDHLLDAMPVNTLRRGYENNEFLEDMMLVKGWRRYTWQTIIQHTDTTDAVIKKLIVEGRVLRNNKMLKKPIELVMMRDTMFATFATSATGYFSLNPADMSVTESRKMFLKVSGDDAYTYNIMSNDTLAKTMLHEADAFLLPAIAKPLVLQTIMQRVLTEQPKAKMLKEVIVTAQKKDVSSYRTTNACGDYVCHANYLNCPYRDEPFTLPVKGQFYHVNYASGKVYVMYAGCVADTEPSLTEVGNVYTAREFYGMDSTMLQQTTPEYMSTLCWKPFVVTDKKGHANFSFFTSDIKGEFRITVQGIAADGQPLFNEKRFTVE